MAVPSKHTGVGPPQLTWVRHLQWLCSFCAQGTHTTSLHLPHPPSRLLAPFSPPPTLTICSSSAGPWHHPGPPHDVLCSHHPLATRFLTAPPTSRDLCFQTVRRCARSSGKGARGQADNVLVRQTLL